MVDAVIEKLLNTGVEIARVNETGDPLYYLKERAVVAHYVPKEERI